jgi:membrane protease YdiL (CAAX protease family)
MTGMTIAPDVRPACEPWKFWGTLIWTAAAIACWVAMQIAVFAAMVASADIAADLEAFASHAVVISIVALAAAPVEIGIVALAVRFARCRLGDYLALAWPGRRDLAIGLLCLLVLLPLADLSTYMSGRGIVPPFVVDAYTSARDSGTLWLLGIALVIAAPLTEEIVFRGFMFRGLQASRVGPVGAVILPSAIWALMHLQ